MGATIQEKMQKHLLEKLIDQRWRGCHCTMHKRVDGEIVWCENETAWKTMGIGVYLEDLTEYEPHPIMTRCYRHLSPVDRVRANSTKFYTIGEDAGGWSEVVYWQAGSEEKRFWCYCFNHHERDRWGEMTEWNTTSFKGFAFIGELEHHAKEMYERYGRGTPLVLPDDGEEELEEAS